MAEKKERKFRDDYHNIFDIDRFLGQYYQNAEGALHVFYLSNYYQFVREHWSKSLDPSKPCDILDFGSGPSPWHLLAFFSSPPTDNTRIVLSDYSEANQQVLVSWIQDSTKHDWTRFYLTAVVQNEEEVRKLGEEDRKKVVAERLDKARKSVQGVLGCDALAENMLSPSRFFSSSSSPLSSFPLITTNLCLEAACNTKEQYTNAITKLATNHLQPSGWLCMCIVFGENYYQVGEEMFHCLPLSMEDVKESVKKAGLEVVVAKCEKMQEEGADLEGAGFVVARKPPF